MPPPTPTAAAAATAETLWDFAQRVYRREGVASLCLRLQDDHGLDVDIVLACLWLASRRQRVDASRLDAMVDAAGPGHALVEQIRGSRRAVGSARTREPLWQASYDLLLAAELAAERVELTQLEAVIESIASPAGAPNELPPEGLCRYARRMKAHSCDAVLDDLVAAALGSSLDRG